MNTSFFPTPMQKKKNQHYVPQFLQRFFSDNGKTIGAYLIDKGQYVSTAPIKNQASGNYFYSQDQKIEDSLAEMEKVAAKALVRLLENPYNALDKEDKFGVYTFVMLQAGRTLEQVEMMNEHAVELVKQVAKEMVRLKTDFPADITEKDINEAKISIPHISLMSIESHLRLIPLCIDLECKMLVNKTSIPFITSDNPACPYNQFLERIGVENSGFACRGIQLYMPISPYVAILYYDGKAYKVGSAHKKVVDITSSTDIHELNKLIALEAHATLYSMDSTHHALPLADYVADRHHFRCEKYTEPIDVNPQDAAAPIIGVRNMMPHRHLSLSFVKQLPRYKAITRDSFNPSIHLYREISAYTDELLEKFFGKRR